MKTPVTGTRHWSLLSAKILGWFSAAALLIVVLASACSSRSAIQREHAAPPAAPADTGKAILKAHMRDGAVYVLDNWRTAGDSVLGTGNHYDAERTLRQQGSLAFSIAAVALFETNRVNSSPVPALTIFSVLTGTVSLVCLSVPKACFGSCPTFYAGANPQILAEGFSASIAPSLEATDIDRLGEATVPAGPFELRMRNEALETHVIRHARLLAFEAIPGSNVQLDVDGKFWRVHTTEVARCSGGEGDCTKAVRSIDGEERRSLADSMNLMERETLELEFVAGAPAEYAISVTARQTLLQTFLFYQALEYMSGDIGRWFTALERTDPGVADGAFGVARALGGIEVLNESGGVAGTLYETGPLAVDTRLIHLGKLAAGRHSLKLRMSKGLWRIDRVAMVTIGERVAPIVLEPARVRSHGQPNADARAALLDPARTLTTMPGDDYQLFYDLPKTHALYELFLESRGYYLEWIRDEWKAGQNPILAAQMLTDPPAALRRLAPEFKRWEPHMENIFWKSRYVRQ